MKNEKTSELVASIAGRVLAHKLPKPFCSGICSKIVKWYTGATIKELRIMAASCLTQTPDRK